tara:strand:- start:25364 stop:26653 length:1290 start_codon:yes stop_codon:yes gene_type:complete
MKKFSLFIVLMSLQACNQEGEINSSDNAHIDDIISEYLFLELSTGMHNKDHVDAYFGSEEIVRMAEEKQITLNEISNRAEKLSNKIKNTENKELLPKKRIDNLLARILAMKTRIRIIQKEFISFDDESQLLFGARAPQNDEEYFIGILKEIDELIPGKEDLALRVNNFKNQFTIKPQYLETVFNTAIDECRKRTLKYINLPKNERFTIEYVTDKPWSGYNWYQGNSHSIIQINTDLPIAISRAIDLGCHEGYPGHHTYNSLIEENLVNNKEWNEYTLSPLYGPQSIIAEGSANYGINLAFPDNQKIEFEKDILFNLAKLETKDADRYYKLLELQNQLNYAGNEAARRYLDGDITREQAILWLTKYSLSSSERAKKSTEFYDKYRSYVINYNLGKDLVESYIENTSQNDQQKWLNFQELLSRPILPAELK